MPTAISNNPLCARRPATIETPGRRLNAARVTPRTPTFVNSPSLSLGSATTATSSGETTGAPSGPRATRRSSATQLPAAALKKDPSSDCAPFCKTMASPAVPLVRSARRNPAAMERIATKTATTNAIPIMARSVDLQRTARLAMLYDSGSAMLGRSEELCDSGAARKNRRQQACCQPQERANQESDSRDRRRHAHPGKCADQIPNNWDLGQETD